MRINILMPIMTFMTRFYHNFTLDLKVIPESKTYFNFFRAALFIMALFLVMSCEEGPTKLGSELLPNSDFITINSIDTISAWSYTLYDVRIPTSAPNFGFIGDMRDPYFGTTTAGFVSQLRLASKWTYGPVTIDSVRMNMNVSIKGGNEAGHILSLSEISDTLNIDSTYYSNTPTHTTGYEVSAVLPALTADSINQKISFALPVSFGEYLIRDTTKLFYSTSKADFRTYFTGLYMQLKPTSDPLMMTFTPVTSATSGVSYNNYIVLYMHDTSYVSLRYVFLLDPVHPNACYNKLERDFSTADPDKRILHINDYTYRDSLSYLQALNGLYTKVVFPGLDSLKKKLGKGKFSINKARLSVPVYYDGNLYTVTTVPSSLRVRYTDKTGIKQDVPDYFLDTNHSFYDGTLHKLDSTYYFNVATYIQLFFEDKENVYKPELEIYQGPTALSSAILRTSTNRKPVKFEMTYTKF